MSDPRHDWTISEIESLYASPLLDLLLRAQLVHREHHQPNEVQGCVLLNVKSGGVLKTARTVRSRPTTAPKPIDTI